MPIFEEVAPEYPMSDTEYDKLAFPSIQNTNSVYTKSVDRK